MSYAHLLGPTGWVGRVPPGKSHENWHGNKEGGIWLQVHLLGGHASGEGGNSGLQWGSLSYLINYLVSCKWDCYVGFGSKHVAGRRWSGRCGWSGPANNNGTIFWTKKSKKQHKAQKRIKKSILSRTPAQSNNHHMAQYLPKGSGPA